MKWGKNTSRIRFEGKKIAIIDENDVDTVFLQAPYNEELVATIKRCIPASKRSWDIGRKVWIVNKLYLKTLIAIACQYFDDVCSNINELATISGDAYEELCVTRNAPDWMIKEVYRIWVKHTHPDAGGDNESFVRKGLAYDSIKKEKKW